MSLLAAIVGFVITLMMLRRSGGVGRHIGAFVLGFIVSMLPTCVWAANLQQGWRVDRVAAVWFTAVAIALVLQIAAMVIAIFLRRKSRSGAAPA
jgi:hypothetical protein